MPVPFSEIFQLEKHLEEGFRAILADVCPNIFITRQSDDKVSPRIEIQAVVGAINGKHVHTFANLQHEMYDAWDGEINVQIVTNRKTDNPLHQHYPMIGRVRYLMQRVILAQNWSNQIVRITDCRQQGTVDSYVDENDLDSTTINFYVLFNINTSGVWPETING